MTDPSMARSRDSSVRDQQGEGRWVLLRVVQRQERFVRDALAKGGLQAYVPIHVSWARQARRKATRARPLIPGYVFADLPDDDAIDLARAVRGVLEIMSQDGRPRRLRPLDVGSLILFEACHAFDETWAPPPVKGRRYSHRWKKGDRVEITSGPFGGFIGEVARARGRKRLEVLLTLFGRVVDTVVEDRELRRPAGESRLAA